MAYSIKFMPRSLTQPGGAVFLDPAHRVTREELDRRDARWRALRERAYARAWSDDATLVGSVQHYAAHALRDYEERTLGRRASRRIVSAGTATSDGASTLQNTMPTHDGSLRRGMAAHTGGSPSAESPGTGRLSTLLNQHRRHRRFRNTLRRLVGVRS